MVKRAAVVLAWAGVISCFRKALPPFVDLAILGTAKSPELYDLKKRFYKTVELEISLKYEFKTVATP